jgi:hypothetical protein
LQEGLATGVWPLHLKPQPDELLSSWIIRLAHAHQLKIENLCTLLFGPQSPIWNRDIDRLAPDWALAGMTHATGTTEERAFQTTLPALAGWLTETIVPRGYARWIVPLGVFHRRRRHPGLMYCPACLAEEPHYYRRLWRIAWATVCVRHRCNLIDTCPACGTPIAPHRSDMAARGTVPTHLTLAICYACQHLLTRQSLLTADADTIVFQARLETALRQGFIDWAGNPSLHSVLFFDGLRFLLTGGLRAMKHNGRLPQRRRVVFEWRPLAERREGMALLMDWLANWPHGFLATVEADHFRSSELTAPQAVLPHWLDQVIHPLIYTPPQTTDSEAEAIMDTVTANVGRPNLRVARRLVGKNITTAWRRTHPRHPPGFAEYEMAMIMLDHRIAGMFDSRHRLILLRAKFMLVARHQLHLTAQALAKLTLEDLAHLDPHPPSVSFYNVPYTTGQAVAWLYWYWQHLRPRLNPAHGEQSIFTSPRTGRALSRSACSYWTHLP